MLKFVLKNNYSEFHGWAQQQILGTANCISVHHHASAFLVQKIKKGFLRTQISAFSVTSMNL